MHIHFCSSTSNVDYGFKLVAKAHTLEKIYPPVVPPPTSECLLVGWRASALKSLYGLVGAKGGGKAAAAGGSEAEGGGGSAGEVGKKILGDECAVLCQALIKESLRVPPKNVQQGGGVKTVVKESAHPYAHNMNSVEECFFKGAKKLTIAFDPKTSTENGCDNVTFYKDQGLSEVIGERYSGGKDGGSCNWPGKKGRPPLVIHGNR